MPTWLHARLRAHVAGETHHKATRRALQLLSLPAASDAPALVRDVANSASSAPEQGSADARRQQMARPAARHMPEGRMPAGGPEPDQAGDGRSSSGAGASCSGRQEGWQQGPGDVWREVQALQQRLAASQHPQACFLPRGACHTLFANTQLPCLRGTSASSDIKASAGSNDAKLFSLIVLSKSFALLHGSCRSRRGLSRVWAQPWATHSLPPCTSWASMPGSKARPSSAHRRSEASCQPHWRTSWTRCSASAQRRGPSRCAARWCRR